MRSLLFCMSLMLGTMLYGQSLELPEPDGLQLQEQQEADENRFEDLYYYLTDHFKVVGEKKNARYYYQSEDLCGFDQEFEQNISYSTTSCGEAVGQTTTIHFPRTPQRVLMDWIRQIHATDPELGENTWRENLSKYEPVDQGVGCYYQIRHTKSQSIVTRYCGC